MKDNTQKQYIEIMDPGIETKKVDVMSFEYDTLHVHTKSDFVVATSKASNTKYFQVFFVNYRIFQ